MKNLSLKHKPDHGTILVYCVSCSCLYFCCLFLIRDDDVHEISSAEDGHQVNNCKAGDDMTLGAEGWFFVII